MRKRIYSSLWILLVVLVFSACSSTKTMKKADSIEGMSEKEYVEFVMDKAGGWQALTAKMTLIANLDGKGETKVGGTLRIKKGEVIQLSIAPFLGIEVARAEFSPKGVLVIDRMNKRYVQVPFSELEAMTRTKLDFQILESLFLNELFLPGRGALTTRDASAFELTPLSEGVEWSVKKAKRFTYRFLTQPSDGWLTQSRLGLQGTPYQLNWKYSDFRPLDNKAFPAEMAVSFEGGKTPVKARFKLSRLSTDSDWESHTEVSDKYEKVEWTDILKMLLKK